MLAQCCKRRAIIRLTLCQRLELLIGCDQIQLTQGIDPMLFLCRADVEDVRRKVEQHWVNALCLL